MPERKKPTKKSPQLPSPERQQQKEAATAQEAGKAAGGQKKQLEDIRLDMMRSVVTEPLLSQVKSDPNGSFDVIISLNELFQGGIEEALRYVKERADAWHVSYSTISHYCFARLTSEQILSLAEEARDLTMQYGKQATVVYRIWEDTDISITLTRSLTTIKADAAQRAFEARGEGIVWAVLDSGIHGDHPHFSNPFSTLDSSRSAPGSLGFHARLSRAGPPPSPP